MLFRNIVPLLLALALTVTAVPTSSSGLSSLNQSINTSSTKENSTEPLDEQTAALLPEKRQYTENSFHDSNSFPVANRTLISNETVHLEKRYSYPFHPLFGPLNPHQVQIDTQRLRQAIQGLGTNENVIIQILTMRSPDQVKQLEAYWIKSYDSFMERAIKWDTSGHLLDALVSCLWTKYEFEAKWLHWAMHGPGTNDNGLVEILLLKSNRELDAIKYTYQQLYGKSLTERIKSDTSGHFRDFFIALLKGRDNVGAFNLESDVTALHAAGPYQLGTDEQTYISIICSRPVQYLRHVFARYFQKYGRPIEYDIRKEFSLNIRMALQRTGFVADEFEDSMLGPGTNDKMLIRLLVRHFRINRFNGLDYRGLVATAYYTKYRKHLRDRIIEDTNLVWQRDYQKTLLSIYHGWH